MLGFLRAYLYWSVLWGFLMHPALGFKPVVPGLLVGADALLLLVSCIYIGLHGPRLASHGDRALLKKSLLPMLALSIYGLGITGWHGGSLIEAGKYLGVLLRPLFVMLALFIWVRTERVLQARQVLHTLQLDFAVLVSAQLLIATLQLVDPVTGGEFISVLNENSSAVWALEDGDVSGTFANSIDLSYFLVAAYIVLTLGSWQRLRPPSLALTGILGFFVDATGSDAALVCFSLYAAYLALRCCSGSVRRLLLSVGALTVILVGYSSGDAIAGRVLDKVDNMMLSRLGLLFVSMPEMISSQPLKLLSGVGGDFEVVLATLRSLPEVPLVFTYDESAVVVNDVFWVALVLAFGVPVVAWLLARMAGLFKAYLLGAQWPSPLLRIDTALLLLILLAGLINQILLVRSFSVALLLGLTPLALARAQVQR